MTSTRMKSTRTTPVSIAALLLVFALSGPGTVHAVDDELSGEHLEPLVPENLTGYPLANVNVKKSSPAVRAEYRPDTEDASIRLVISYGKDAADDYRTLRGKMALAAAEGEMDPDEVSVQGRTFVAFQMGDRSVAMAYFDHFLLGVNVEGLDAPKEAIVDFLEDVDLNRLSEWTPPENVEYALDDSGAAVPDCFDAECFSDHLSRCEEARFVGALGRRITAAYTIEESLADDRCQVSLVYTDNPNPAWEDAPLYFTLDPAEGFSMETVKAVMEDCLNGDGDTYDCEGPLLEHMQDQ